MPSFKLKSDLPRSTQDEIDRVQSISEGLRNQEEQDFLTALRDYLYNEVILRDSLERIVIASGITLPTGDTGFKKGAVFIKKDAPDDGRYYNSGNENYAIWGATGSPSPSASVSPSSSSSSSTSPSVSPSASPSA